MQPPLKTPPQLQLFVAELSDHEREGGACPTCGTRARLFTCWECCDSGWVIDCSHRAGNAPLRRGRLDGSDMHRVFCADCADVLLEESDDPEV
jgi:hypothetical protein